MFKPDIVQVADAVRPSHTATGAAGAFWRLTGDFRWWERQGTPAQVEFAVAALHSLVPDDGSRTEAGFLQSEADALCEAAEELEERSHRRRARLRRRLATFAEGCRVICRVAASARTVALEDDAWAIVMRWWWSSEFLSSRQSSCWRAWRRFNRTDRHFSWRLGLVRDAEAAERAAIFEQRDDGNEGACITWNTWVATFWGS